MKSKNYETEDYCNLPEYTANIKLFSEERSGCNTNVKEKVNALSEKDFTRLPVFSEREKYRKKSLNYRFYLQQP